MVTMISEPKSSSSPVRNSVLVYVRNRVEGISEEELLLDTYDLAIVSCVRKDDLPASRCIAELINALNFDYPEVATGLFRLYRYCLDLVKDQKWDEAAGILRELRRTWAEALGYPIRRAANN